MFWTFVEYDFYLGNFYVLTTSDTDVRDAIDYVINFNSGWKRAAVYDKYGNIYYAKEFEQ